MHLQADYARRGIPPTTDSVISRLPQCSRLNMMWSQQRHWELTGDPANRDRTRPDSCLRRGDFHGHRAPVRRALFNEYVSLVEAETRAEREAIRLTHHIRQKVDFDDNGKLVGRPSPVDVGREAEAWARVAALRSKRYEWMAEHA